MKIYTILIADDDEGLVRILEKTFSQKGFYVYTANNGTDALKQYYACKPKAILMDIDMPEINGWEVLAQIRKENRFIPIIIMTGKHIEETDAIKSFDDGATSFIRKSVCYKEIVASVESLLRLAYSPEEYFSLGTFILKMSTSSFHTGDEEYSLTVREAQVFRLLATNVNQIVEKETILHSVWGSNTFSNCQMLRNTISKLNKLLETNGKIHIKSIYGKGYLLQNKLIISRINIF